MIKILDTFKGIKCQVIFKDCNQYLVIRTGYVIDEDSESILFKTVKNEIVLINKKTIQLIKNDERASDSKNKK